LNFPAYETVSRDARINVEAEEPSFKIESEFTADATPANDSENKNGWLADVDEEYISAESTWDLMMDRDKLQRKKQQQERHERDTPR
jgi:hypothetical protein